MMYSISGSAPDQFELQIRIELKIRDEIIVDFACRQKHFGRLIIVVIYIAYFTRTVTLDTFLIEWTLGRSSFFSRVVKSSWASLYCNNVEISPEYTAKCNVVCSPFQWHYIDQPIIIWSKCYINEADFQYFSAISFGNYYCWCSQSDDNNVSTEIKRFTFAKCVPEALHGSYLHANVG